MIRWRSTERIFHAYRDSEQLQENPGLPVSGKEIPFAAKGTKTVIRKLKQRVVSTAAKVKRYSDRVIQYKENAMFKSSMNI